MQWKKKKFIKNKESNGLILDTSEKDKKKPKAENKKQEKAKQIDSSNILFENLYLFLKIMK